MRLNRAKPDQQQADLYGRGSVTRFVTSCLDRSAGPSALPVVLLLGPCGTGKTVLLQQLNGQLGESAPTAWVDFARDPDANPLTVMLVIVRGLSRHVARVGSVRFPRLTLGLAALSLDPGSAATPAEQLERRLNGAEQENGPPLGELIQQAGKLLPSELQLAVNEGGTLIAWLLSEVGGRHRRQYLQWYAGAIGLADGTELGPLLELYRQWREDSPSARRTVWKVLCQALLADLRADFNGFSLRHGQRTTNCLLLLDNTDNRAGTGLLEALAECRGPRSADGLLAGKDPVGPDPLLVVAAQRRRPAVQLAVDKPAIAVDSLLHATWQQSQQERPSAWCPVLLTDLSGNDVRTLVSSTVLGRSQRDADFLHAVTGGHPAATRELAMKLGTGAPRLDPRRLLCPPDPADGSGGDAAIVGEDMLRRLRPDWVSDTDLDALAVCSLTPGLRRVACASVFRYLGWRDTDVQDVRDRLLELMWVDDAPDDWPVIRPLMRLLLTRWLARDKALWRDVHDGYLCHYSSAHDAVAMHHHSLALTTVADPANLAKVAAYLEAELIPERAVAEWNAALKAITAAPNQLDAIGDQRYTVNRLAGPKEPGDRLRTVTRLVAARWLVHDRLFDPGWRLARLIADEYADLARLADGDTEVFYEESDHFRRIAYEWEDMP
jgi:hypothetical protein